jgi:hypothetical protein
MPGSNNGTGYPLTLRCWRCVRSRLYWPGREGDLVWTGKLRPAKYRGYRQTTRRIQYRCRACGYVGWSQHSDAERLVTRAGGPPPPKWERVRP